MTSDLIEPAAIASTSIIMSFILHSTIRRQGNRPAFRFGQNRNHFISFTTATIVIIIEAALGIALEELVVKPHVTLLYEQNQDRIYAILFASAVGFGLNIWRLTGIARRHQVWFVLACVVSGWVLFSGLHILPP